MPDVRSTKSFINLTEVVLQEIHVTFLHIIRETLLTLVNPQTREEQTEQLYWPKKQFKYKNTYWVTHSKLK